jgi:protein tyrosine/serine phosphatase
VASSSLDASRRVDRRLAWDGCFNVRELGGHRTLDGALTRWHAVVRSDARERLTESGWSALRRHGITSIIDLRDPTEHSPTLTPVGDIEVISVPLLDLRDQEFWGDGRWRGNDHSTAFYVAVVERWPERLAAAVTQVARARSGAVLIHCQAGRDRTGLVAAALLALVGVGNGAIAEDYSESQRCLQPLYDTWLANASDELECERIRRANVSDARVMLELLATIDLPGRLVEHGLAGADLDRLRRRFVVAPHI